MGVSLGLCVGRPCGHCRKKSALGLGKTNGGGGTERISLRQGFGRQEAFGDCRVAALLAMTDKGAGGLGTHA
jgi:hypothetical protein